MSESSGRPKRTTRDTAPLVIGVTVLLVNTGSVWYYMSQGVFDNVQAALIWAAGIAFSFFAWFVCKTILKIGSKK